MSGPVSPGDRHAQAPPNRPPLPTACAGLDPSISLCGIPKTEEARKTWQTIVGTIQVDLQGLEKLLWWSVGCLMIPGGRLYFEEVGYGHTGMAPEKILEEGQFDAWACCQAVLRVCKKALEYQWRTSAGSVDLVREDHEFIHNTIACFVVFGNHWRKGLERAPHGKAEHNAWRDACYGTVNPSRALMAKVPPALGVLEDLSVGINSTLEDPDAVTPAALEAAILRLPPNWMIWKGFVVTYYQIQDTVLDGKMIPFANKLEYSV